MTAEEVWKKLTDKGFTLRRIDVLGYTIVEHRGEQVACIYDNYVCIAKHYPSINSDGISTSYADADKFVIMFSHPISEVDTAIQWLLESPERIDRVKRKNRIDAIRRYFDERRSRVSSETRHSETRHSSETAPLRILNSYMGYSSRHLSRISTPADDE